MTTPPDTTTAAAPWPERWLTPPGPDDPPRVVELCAGPGGWAEGIATVLGLELDTVGVDIDPDACATAQAAGHHRITADITTLDPEHPALRHTAGAIISPPCPPWSPAGLHGGHDAHNLAILSEVITSVGEAAGFIRVDDAGDGYEGYAPRSGATWAEVREPLAELTDPRVGLMAEVALWPMALQTAGAPLAWVAMEQSSALPEVVTEDLWLEFECAGWEHTKFEVLDAADYGLASRRKRMFMMATRYGFPAGNPRPEQPIPPTPAARALDWGPGERIVTRGQRGTDERGRAKGGGSFSTDGPAWCLTGRARSWYRESDRRHLTPEQAGLLVGFRPGYPWRGSRTSRFRQAGDVVSPIMSAAVVGAILGCHWDQRVRDHLHTLYGPPEPSPPAAHPDLEPHQLTLWA